MIIARDIVYISIFFWLLPPFRQFRGAFFYFFLILSLYDPISLLFVKSTGLNPDFIHVFLGILLFYSINFKITDISKNIFWHIAFLSTLLLILIISRSPQIILLIIHFCILLKLIRLLLIKIYTDNAFNIFLLAIVFYEISAVLNLLVYLTANEMWLIIYYTTSAFQIFLAIFFTIFTDKSKTLILKIKSAD